MTTTLLEAGDKVSLLLTPRIIRDISVLEHHIHARWRVYPQNISLDVTLAANAAANTFGDWVEIIPLNTVPFAFDVIGMIIETVSAVGKYQIQIGYSITDEDDPGANDVMGERRFPTTDFPPKRATELMEIASQNIPANAKVWGRVKTASTNADTCKVSVVLTRHVPITNPVPIYHAFPW